MSAENENDNTVNEPTNEQETDMSTSTAGAVKSKKKSSAKKAASKSSTKKSASKAAPKDKKPGVIDTILEAITRDEGASFKEIMDLLTKRFKDKPEEGMATTVRIQVTRLPKSKGNEFEMKKTKTEDRGLVYKAPKSVFNKRMKGKLGNGNGAGEKAA